MPRFLGREKELELLLDLCQKKSASFVVIKGRRRIGKSRLVEELSKHFSQFYAFTGLPPDHKLTAQQQLDEFSRQIALKWLAKTGHKIGKNKLCFAPINKKK